MEADQKILWNGLNYSKITIAIKKRGVGVCADEINLSVPDQTVFEKSILEYYRGCFSAKFNPAFFQNVKAWLMKKPEKLNSFEIDVLVNAIFLIHDFPIQIESFTLSISNLIDKDIENTSFVLNEIFIISQFFINEKQAEIAAQLNQFILNLLQKIELTENELCDVYNILGGLYKCLNLLKGSESAFLKAILYFDKKTNSEKSDIFYTLGSTQMLLSENKSAIEKFCIGISF